MRVVHTSPDATRFRFGPHTLDLDTRTLLRTMKPVAVEPRTFDVLVHLVRHRDRVVRKTELVDEVWGHQFVSDSALTSQIKLARRAVGDDGSEQRLIKTIHRVGYRFVGEVEQSAAVESHDRAVTITGTPTPSLT